MKFGYYTDRGLPEGDYRCPSWDPMPEGKKNVVILGCSHTYGVGLEPNETWAHHVSQHNTKQVRYWNLGQPGASADHIVRILYGSEKLIFPEIIIVCWPDISRRERLTHAKALNLLGKDESLKYEDDETDKNNFLKNLFLVEKYAEKNFCLTFHCFAQEKYPHEPIQGLNVLEHYTIKNCWPYWDKFEQRQQFKEPSFAKDGQHYGVEHHERFANLFLEQFGAKLQFGAR